MALFDKNKIESFFESLLDQIDKKVDNMVSKTEATTEKFLIGNT